MIFRNKKPYNYYSKHNKDSYKNLGFMYHGNLFKNMLSAEIFSNPTMDVMFRQLERLMERLIDSVKSIKCQFFISKDKDDINFN